MLLLLLLFGGFDSNIMIAIVRVTRSTGESGGTVMVAAVMTETMTETMTVTGSSGDKGGVGDSDGGSGDDGDNDGNR